MPSRSPSGFPAGGRLRVLLVHSIKEMVAHEGAGLPRASSGPWRGTVVGLRRVSASRVSKKAPEWWSHGERPALASIHLDAAKGGTGAEDMFGFNSRWVACEGNFIAGLEEGKMRTTNGTSSDPTPAALRNLSKMNLLLPS